MVDDEPIYRSAVVTLLTHTSALEVAVEVLTAEDSASALAVARERSLDLVLSDVDLGAHSPSGFDLIKELRRMLGAAPLLCVHSNRMGTSDYKTAIANGADAFLPKPIARVQLLKLLLEAFHRLPLTLQASAAPLNDGNKPEVAVVEDNTFMLEAWTVALEQEATVHAFDSPEAFAARIDEDTHFLDRLTYVVTDLRFDGSPADGLTVGRLTKSKRAALPVLLGSDGQIDEQDIAGVIDHVIPKEPMRVLELLRLGGAAAQRKTER
jgi:CheY-like chemotaxis protein